MFKFFRNIRKGLLKENKIGKYLAYAIGEIILVVIGILIALYFNGQRQQQINEKEYEVQFRSLRNELMENTNEIVEAMVGMQIADSTRAEALYNRPTDSSIEENWEADFDLIILSAGVTHNSLYSILNSNQNIPKKYDTIISMMRNLDDILKIDLKWRVDLKFKCFELIRANRMRYPWYYREWDDEKIEGIKTYLKTDPLRKNYLSEMRNIDVSQIANLFRYRRKSLEIISLLDSILKDQPQKLQIQYPEYKHFIGKYQKIEPSGHPTDKSTDLTFTKLDSITFTIVENEGLLIWRQTDSLSSELRLISISKGVLVDQNGFFSYLMTANHDQDTLLMDNHGPYMNYSQYYKKLSD